MVVKTGYANTETQYTTKVQWSTVKTTHKKSDVDKSVGSRFKKLNATNAPRVHAKDGCCNCGTAEQIA